MGVQTVADRFAYLPQIGLAVALAWALPMFAGRGRVRRRGASPAALGIGGPGRVARGGRPPSGTTV